MPAELPIFEWNGTRRELLRGGARLGLVTAGSIYLAPLIAACEQQPKIEILERKFNPEFVRWIAEQEGKETVYFLAQVKNQHDLIFFVTLEKERAKISTLDRRGNYTKIFEGDVCQLLNEEWVAEWLPIVNNRFGITVPKELCDRLLPILREPLINKLEQEASKIQDFSLSLIREGSLIADRDSSWLLARGRRYQIGAGAAKFLGTSSASPIPKPFFERIPESENKLNFREGGILVGTDRTAWYLNNGGRYRISEDIRSFTQSRYKNFKVHEVSQWVVEKIERHKEPTSTFRDQYGREINANSPRLLVFMAGLGSSSETDQSNFGKIIQGLRLLGWKDNQILFASHNVQVVKGKNGEKQIVPHLHTRQHAQSPQKSREAGKLYLDWLRRLAPRSQLVLCGHSMGGDAVFHATVTHPDLVCQVITVNAPLVGVDKNYLSLPVEDLVAFGCNEGIEKCEAIQFYVAAGENPTYGSNIENWANQIRDQGVDLFTFSAIRDLIVPTSRAVLKNSNNRIGDYHVRLEWDLSEYRWDPKKNLIKSVHGLLLDYDPYIVELMKVIGRP